MKAVASCLGHTSTRMMDTVYVEVYSDVSRQLADAIHRLGLKAGGSVRCSEWESVLIISTSGRTGYGHEYP